MTPPIEIDHAGKRLGGRDVVQDVSLSSERGRVTALLGHNGAGKTTLIKMTLGLSRPTSGAIRVLGEDPAGPRVRARMGFLPENVSFSPALTGKELLAFYARLKGESPSACVALLDRVGLGAASSRPIAEYSKGMRQRLGLAQALIGSPRILLLDEPTTGLDAAARQGFYEIILELRAQGAAVLLSSHSLTELEEHADQVVIMHRGTIVAKGSIEELQEIADLPVTISVSLREGAPDPKSLGPAENWRARGRRAEMACSRKNKMAALRAIMDNQDAIEDVAIMPPTLDQLYAYFLRQKDDAR
ncbi:ABC transporter ATP-binding protein [Methylocystis sp. JAN1]|uniref:ABC transporter ATP-binding protein n=1 Tax=Methylocystis sp. JAN1 TaxID=3397211 RepID=UPI003FA1DDE8